MQIAATTSQAALTASPRLSATIPKETAPSAATAAHKSFVCSVFELLSLTLIGSSRTAAKDKHNSHADDIDQVQSVFALRLAAYRKQPPDRHTAEKRDELAAPDHSITSSARAS